MALGTSLGCNPSAGDINGALGTATATDACGAPTISVSDGSVTSNGCSRSQTRTWTAKDGCGNTSTASRTVTWTADVTPPAITTGGSSLTLGCNPSAGDINASLGTATATDACGAPTISVSDGSVTSNGCSRSQTRTWTAIDACSNTSTASRTVTWTSDLTPPTFTGTYDDVPLGCNPKAGNITTALDGATATDACSVPSLTQTDGSVVSNGCSRSQTRTFTARDACGNTATISRTATWTEDLTPPVFTGTYSNVDIGCNPTSTAITTALDGATATDACSTPVITFKDGTVTSNGCVRTQTRTFTAKDVCNNTATVSRTVTWTADLTAPAITTGGGSLTLGCNPSAGDINASLGTATATDACGAPTISVSDSPVTSNGCSRSQTRTWLAIDACNNTSTASRTVTWTSDITPPTITTGGGSLTLGCNPSAGDINASLGTATATDACGAPTISVSDSPVSSNGCSRSQTRTWTAKDGCNNTSTASRTVTWTSDLTPPAITTGGSSLTLGCNPSAGDINASLGTATATDACGAPTISVSDSPVTSNGCSRSQTRTWTAIDACNNTSTASRTVTWTADLTPPTITTGGGTLTLGCNPSAGDINSSLGTATATDACGAPTISVSDSPVSSNGCSRSQTRTWLAIDGCNNTSTASRTVTWTADLTPPTFTGNYGTVNLACNPKGNDVPNALDGATATDACGDPTITQTDGSVTSNGCNRTQTRTFTARDICGNTATVSRTVTWIADVTPPTFTGNYNNVPLGCNPSAGDISGALGSSTATDACGTPTIISFKDDDVTSNGCSRSQTRTFYAKDGCDNISSISRTATWTSDLTPPTAVVGGANLNLGCNPTAADINAALGTATASDACGPTTLTQSDGAVTSNGCNRSQTRTFTAKDACGNMITATRTAVWTSDVTPPVVSLTPAPALAACNPSATDVDASLGTATATDACGTPTVTQSDGNVVSNGCGRSQTRTFTARDACGNTSTTSRTVNWTYDVTPPTATNRSSSYKCATDVPAPNPAVITDEADNCGGTPTVAYLPLATTNNGGAGCPGNALVITRYYQLTDGCNNTSTVSHTITVIDDEAPGVSCKNISVTLGTGGYVDIVATDVTASSSDNCSSVTVSVDKTHFTDAEVGSTCSKAFTVKLTASDACGNTSTCNATVTVNKRPTKLVYSGDLSEQYSDAAYLKATLYDMTGGLPGVPIQNKTVTFTIGTQSVSDTYGGSGGGTSYLGEATANLTINQSPIPTYTVVSSFAGDGTYCPSSDSDPFDITPEDACGSYNGTLFVNSNSPTGGTATVRFQVVVTEDADGSLGDVRNATVKFYVNDAATNAPVAGSPFTAVMDPGSTATQATFYYDYVVTLSSSNLCKTFDVSWVVNNYYTNANCDDQSTQVTVAAPSDDFSAGGGYIILTSNAYGPNVAPGGIASGKNNWGYNVKWNKSLTNLQGNFNTIIRRNGRTYHVKSNKPTFLKITVISPPNTTPVKRKAEITYGNAVLKDVTDIVNGVCVNPSGCWGEGNGTIYLTVEDNGEPGSTGATLDRIGFAVKDKNNVLWYSTNTWVNSTSTITLQNLDGGNIQIRQGTSSGAPTKTTDASITMDKPAEAVLPFNVKAFPNPTEHQFTLYLEGASNEKVQIVVYDAIGRQVKKIERGDGSGAIKFGEDLKVGAYIVEVRQGVNRKTLKLVKQ